MIKIGDVDKKNYDLSELRGTLDKAILLKTFLYQKTIDQIISETDSLKEELREAVLNLNIQTIDQKTRHFTDEDINAIFKEQSA